MLSIEPYIQASSTFEQISETYLNALEKNAVFENQNAASIVREYFQPESKMFFCGLEHIKNELNKINSSVPASSSVTDRKKPFYSFCKKVEQYSPHIDEISDTYALRTVISSHMIGKEMATEQCYNLAIKYFMYFRHAKRFTVIPVPTKSDGPLAEGISDMIYIPNDSVINPLVSGYEGYFKDYIRVPKHLGYQSLHIIVLDLKTGKKIEIQIRTDEMHNFAEKGPANHAKYKNFKYNDYEFDFSKLHVEGIEVEGRKVIEDPFGLFLPLSIGEPCVVEKPHDMIDWL